MAPLTELELITGIGFVAIIIFGWAMGIVVLRKYAKFRQREILYLGIFMLFMNRQYWASTSGYLYALFSPFYIDEIAYLFIGYFFSISAIIWLLIITELVFKSKQKIVLIVILVLSVIINTIFLYLVFNNPSLIGTYTPPFRFQMGPFLFISRVLLAIIIFPITTFLLYWKTRRTDNPGTRLKGKLIFIGSIIYILSVVVHGIFQNSFITLAFSAAGLIIFYGGFLLPPWIMRFFLGNLEAGNESSEE
jgi:hypothetical protein